MAVTPDKVQIGSSQDFLDGVAVDTAAGTGLFRETVVLADPESGGGLANVRQLSTQLVNTDKGVVTNTVIHGWTTAGGGSFVDIKANPSGALTVDATGSVVGLDATSLAALENINVTVTNTEVEVKNDVGNPIPVSGSVSVSNFPATQSVSGTVTANAGTGTFNVAGTVTANQGGTWNVNNITGTVSLPTGAATSANQTTGNASLSSIDGKTPDESGAWGYNAGTAGTLNVAANKRILAISATSPALVGGTMTINGGQTITIPAGTSITITPKANLVAPTIVFTGTASYFVEFIE